MDTFLQAAHIGRVVKESAGLPEWLSSKEPACQCRRHRRHGFNPWIRKIPWSRKWRSIPVFLPGEFYGQRSPVGFSPWGCKESDMIEHPHTQEPTWTHHSHPKSTVYLSVHSWCCTFCEFGQMYKDISTITVLTALRILCALP